VELERTDRRSGLVNFSSLLVSSSPRPVLMKRMSLSFR